MFATQHSYAVFHKSFKLLTGAPCLWAVCIILKCKPLRRRCAATQLPGSYFLRSCVNVHACMSYVNTSRYTSAIQINCTVLNGALTSHVQHCATQEVYGDAAAGQLLSALLRLLANTSHTS